MPYCEGIEAVVMEEQALQRPATLPAGRYSTCLAYLVSCIALIFRTPRQQQELQHPHTRIRESLALRVPGVSWRG